MTKLIGQASTYLGEGNTDLAQSKLQRALRISPKDAEVYYYLAKLRWQKKEYKQSIGLIDRGLSYVGRNRKLEQKLWVLKSVNYDSLGQRKSSKALERADELEVKMEE